MLIFRADHSSSKTLRGHGLRGAPPHRRMRIWSHIRVGERYAVPYLMLGGWRFM